MEIYHPLFWENLFFLIFSWNLIYDKIIKLKAHHFHSTKCLADDLCALNEWGEFGLTYKGIYPKELELKMEHKGFYAYFLNLDINSVDREFIKYMMKEIPLNVLLWGCPSLTVIYLKKYI